MKSGNPSFRFFDCDDYNTLIRRRSISFFNVPFMSYKLKVYLFYSFQSFYIFELYHLHQFQAVPRLKAKSGRTCRASALSQKVIAVSSQDHSFLFCHFSGRPFVILPSPARSPGQTCQKLYSDCFPPAFGLPPARQGSPYPIPAPCPRWRRGMCRGIPPLW